MLVARTLAIPSLTNSLLWTRLVVGAYEVCGERETLLGTTCSEPFTVVRNNDNTEGASYSPIQIPIRHTWTGWGLGPVQVHPSTNPDQNRANITLCRGSTLMS